MSQTERERRRRKYGRTFETDVPMHNAVLRMNPAVSNGTAVLEASIKKTKQNKTLHALLVYSLTISNWDQF